MNIIELAKEAGLNMPDRRNDLWMPQFERFAALVRVMAFVEAAAIVLNSPSRDAAVDELERRAK